jgi:hypothetical protein
MFVRVVVGNLNLGTFDGCWAYSMYWGVYNIGMGKVVKKGVEVGGMVVVAVVGCLA